MKKHLFSILTALMLVVACAAHTGKSNEKTIEKTIKAFAAAGDQQNAEKLDDLLSEHYRVVMNQLFGSKDISILNKEAYLGKIRNKEFGGDKRKVGIENLVISGHNASAKVTLSGEKLTMVSILVLVQNAKGDWQLISDTPSIKSE